MLYAHDARQKSDKARTSLASQAKMNDVINYISDRSEEGKYSAVINCLTEGQVYKLHDLGYDVDYNGEGTYSIVRWEKC